MYESIIKNYVSKLTKDHIRTFCIKENIIISDEEIDSYLPVELRKGK